MLIIERTSAAVPIIGTAGPVCRPALFLPGEVGNFLQADAAVLCVNSNVQFPVPVSGPEIFPAVQMRVVEESGYIAAVGTQVDLRAAGGLFVVNGSASVYCAERNFLFHVCAGLKRAVCGMEFEYFTGSADIYGAVDRGSLQRLHLAVFQMDPAVDTVKVAGSCAEMLCADFAVDRIDTCGRYGEIFQMDFSICVGNIEIVHGRRNGKGESSVCPGDAQPPEERQGFFSENQSVALCIHFKLFRKIVSVIIAENIRDISALQTDGGGEQADPDLRDRLL